MNEIVKTQNSLAERPEFVGGIATDEQQMLQQYARPPMMKIVQKQSDDEDITRFGIGSVVLKPDDTVIHTADGEPFEIIPLAFYSEFVKWSPIQLKGSEDAVVERTLDEKSELAKRCRDLKLRLEPHPNHDGAFYVNVEHLNFLVKLSDYPIPCIMSFAKSGYKDGQRLFNLILARQAPMCACRFAVRSAKKKNQHGSWYGFGIDNALKPWVNDKAEFEALSSESNTLKKLIAENKLQASYDEPVTEASHDPGDDDKSGI